MTQNESPSFQFVAVHVHPLWRNFQIDFLPPVSAELRAPRTFLLSNVAANVGDCTGSSGSGVWWLGGGVLRYRGHWVGVMCNGDLWGLGTRKWAQCGATTMLWSERELGTCGAEHDTVTKCERPALFSIESDVLCAPGHFLEIRSMAEEGWDWTQWTNSIRMYQWRLSQTSPNITLDHR